MRLLRLSEALTHEQPRMAKDQPIRLFASAELKCVSAKEAGQAKSTPSVGEAASLDSSADNSKPWTSSSALCPDGMNADVGTTISFLPVSCPHYIGASTTAIFAWIALANSGIAEDRSKSEILQRQARYYLQLMTPTDPRWGIRALLCEGDGRPGSSPFLGILGTLFRRGAPELSAQLMQMWKEGGSDLSGGHGRAGLPDP